MHNATICGRSLVVSGCVALTRKTPLPILGLSIRIYPSNSGRVNLCYYTTLRYLLNILKGQLILDSLSTWNLIKEWIRIKKQRLSAIRCSVSLLLAIYIMYVCIVFYVIPSKTLYLACPLSPDFAKTFDLALVQDFASAMTQDRLF